MTSLLRVLPLLSVLALAGCASSAQTTSQFAQGPIVTQAPSTVAVAPLANPAQNTAEALAQTDVEAFVDPAAFKLMGNKAKLEATGAQYNALQFGRPGAPRAWAGDSATGSVTVGPDLMVNNLRCRNFTHTVTISGTTYTRQGQSCRETSGRWAVVNSTVG